MRPAVLALVCLPACGSDWLIQPPRTATALQAGPQRHELSLSNGLIRRVWRISPNAATVALDQVPLQKALLRGVKPEAVVEIDGLRYEVGGLAGQPDYAYLRREWLDKMTAAPGAFRFVRHESGPAGTPLEWKRGRYAPAAPWPPKGVRLTLHFDSPARAGVAVAVCYEMFDGLPVLAKWISVKNGTQRPLRLNRFTSEVLAVVESESNVEGTPPSPDSLYVEAEYAFHGMDPRTSNQAVHWVEDPQYSTQVNYARKTPAQLEVRPPIGPDVLIEPGASFDSFRVFELVYDSTDRERNGLARRRMYRTLAPWTQENPILMHVRKSDPASVRAAVDQCADVGFEMVILSFGSGFDMEREDPAYLEEIRSLVGYARSKGVELGGYSLLASRKISPGDDVINPRTGAPGGSIFGESPCLGSRWGIDYFRKLRAFIETTGVSVLEHDGSYPGDLCVPTKHPGHRGLDDSQWAQWRTIADFYGWSRARGVYLNVPDWYFFSGSNKTGMGYREVNWSLPREQQIILGRQNIFDGTWDKTPSMGWMFVPLVEYQGGGSAATLEPLREHLDAYRQHLVQNFGAGVQACYRGPRLFDSDEVRAEVRKWVAFYKQHRAILDSDLIHVRRPDGANLDIVLHVNPALSEKGLAMVYNPLDTHVSAGITLPLYYTGLTRQARVVPLHGPPATVRLNERHEALIPVNLAPRGFTALVFRGR